MKPSQSPLRRVLNPWLLALASTSILLGCTSPLMLYHNSEEVAEIEDLNLELEEEIRLVKDVTIPWGIHYLKLEGVALATGLDRTGSDPPPSAQRAALISDMQTYDVKKPNLMLASDETSLVLVRGYLPPGVRKGDRFDVEVRVPTRSETTSLSGGWLMRSRLREVAMLDSSLHTGHVEALAKGPVVIDALFETDNDEVREVQGRVLGGGVALASRPLGLSVRSENHSIRTASLIGAAINARFHTYDRGVKRGVATPKRDNFVELEVHPRYEHNLGRYVRVAQNIALGESPVERVRRIELLERKLLDPATAPAAALQLEAIGKEAIVVLEKGLGADDPVVRFYAAEALAYMDEAPASDALAEATRTEPAFRWHAIAALSAMDHISAYDALVDLLHVPSAETRYAAFRALRTRNGLDPLVRGTRMGDEFTYHAVDTDGPPMIHFSRSRVPEIVVFGQDVRLERPDFLYAGKSIMLKSAGTDRVEVVCFEAGEDDRREECSNRLDDVVRTIAEMGGGYAEVIQCLREAKRKEYLEPRIVVDALPTAGRIHRRQEDEGDQQEMAAPQTSTPMPDIFDNRLSGGSRDESNGDGSELIDIDPQEEGEDAGFLDKLGDWF
jgi:hypothetical protein